MTDRNINQLPEPLHFDSVPVERTWELSIMLHEKLRHTEPWEICDLGCDQIAEDAVRILFGATRNSLTLRNGEGQTNG